MNRFFACTCNTRAVLPDSLRYIRSDVPLQVTEQEKDGLLAEDIRTVVDLRTPEECTAKPCPLEGDERFCYLHLPVTGGNALPESRAMVPVSYLKMVDGQMERILDAISGAESNVLYFCSAGKDRTGVVSALLLRRAGMPEEYILQDYLQSGPNLATRLEAFARQNPGLDMEIITPREEYMRQFLRELPQP